MPKISVIIPNYNHARFLKHRIDSVLDQTFQDFEIIILDDASTDSSKTIIEQYRHNPKVSQIVYNKNNSGSPFSQWEKGMKLTQSEWLWIAESDDYADPGFLESLMSLSETQRDTGIAFCDTTIVDEDQKQSDASATYNEGNLTYNNGINEVRDRLCKYCTIINVSSCIIKKEHALAAVNGLGRYKACGDWIFYTRLLQHTNFSYSEKKLNFYRYHNKCVSYTASTNGLWVTEGIDVLKNIDFKVVRFSVKQFLSVNKIWMPELAKVKLTEGLKVLYTMLVVSYRFCIARF